MGLDSFPLGHNMGQIKMRRLPDHIARMTVPGKIDLLARAVFGDIDDETLKQTDGLLGKLKRVDEKLAYIMWGGAFSSAVIVLHFCGVPTNLIWGLASKAAAATLGH